jgi:hypothetical protein
MSKNPGIRKRVTRPDTGPKPQTPAEAAASIPAPSVRLTASILGGDVPGPYARVPHDDGNFELKSPPSWQESGKNPYSRDN